MESMKGSLKETRSMEKRKKEKMNEKSQGKDRRAKGPERERQRKMVRDALLPMLETKVKTIHNETMKNREKDRRIPLNEAFQKQGYK